VKPQALAAEFIGSSMLAATVIGSGIAASNLSGGNSAIALLVNAIATGCILYVLISMFAPLSGAHLNPVVSIAFALRRETPWLDCGCYGIAQVAGMIFGAWVAHGMFDLPMLQVSTTVRSSLGMAAGEIVATLGLVLTILGLKDSDMARVPAAVALYIMSAYWFTPSTSFANPAITIARSFTDTFAGIAPVSVPLFIASQLAGMLAAVMLVALFWPKPAKLTPPS
jgi:glycerol uptake facilitator-like aquaporin